VFRDLASLKTKAHVPPTAVVAFVPCFHAITKTSCFVKHDRRMEVLEGLAPRGDHEVNTEVDSFQKFVQSKVNYQPQKLLNSLKLNE
jgi:hypothetical protein